MQGLFRNWSSEELLDLIETLGATETGEKAQVLIGKALEESRRTGLAPRLGFPEEMLDEVEILTGDTAWLARTSPLWTGAFVQTIGAHYYRTEGGECVFFADLRELEYQRIADLEESKVAARKSKDRKNHRSSKHYSSTASRAERAGFKLVEAAC